MRTMQRSRVDCRRPFATHSSIDNRHNFMSQEPGVYLPTLTDTTSQTLAFTLVGAVVPKQRARSNGTQHYLPQRYRDWKDCAITQLIAQRMQLNNFQLPIQNCTVTIALYGAHRGDLDNLAGSVLDALVQASVLKDDRVSCVHRLAIAHQPNPKKYCTISVETIQEVHK
jgi:Holliday junction resolvase RusA-like endonuclease